MNDYRTENHIQSLLKQFLEWRNIPQDEINLSIVSTPQAPWLLRRYAHTFFINLAHANMYTKKTYAFILCKQFQDLLSRPHLASREPLVRPTPSVHELQQVQAVCIVAQFFIEQYSYNEDDLILALAQTRPYRQDRYSIQCFQRLLGSVFSLYHSFTRSTTMLLLPLLECYSNSAILPCMVAPTVHQHWIIHPKLPPNLAAMLNRLQTRAAGDCQRFLCTTKIVYTQLSKAL